MIIFLILSLPAGVILYNYLANPVTDAKILRTPFTMGVFWTLFLLCLYWIITGVIDPPWTAGANWAHHFFRNYLSFLFPLAVLFGLWKNHATDYNTLKIQIFWLTLGNLTVVSVTDLFLFQEYWGIQELVLAPLLRLSLLFLLPNLLAAAFTGNLLKALIGIVLSLILVASLALAISLAQFNYPLWSGLLALLVFGLGVSDRILGLTDKVLL